MLLVSNSLNGSIDFNDINGVLFGGWEASSTLDALEFESKSLFWRPLCDSYEIGGVGAPIIWWMDLSMVVKNLPINFEGARFELYPPCVDTWTKQG